MEIITENNREKQIWGEMPATLSEKAFRRLSELIHRECGIKMPAPKKIMLEARLRKRLRELGIKSFDAYCKYLFSPKGLEMS